MENLDFLIRKFSYRSFKDEVKDQNLKNHFAKKGPWCGYLRLSHRESSKRGDSCLFLQEVYINPSNSFQPDTLIPSQSTRIGEKWNGKPRNFTWTIGYRVRSFCNQFLYAWTDKDCDDYIIVLLTILANLCCNKSSLLLVQWHL